MKAIKFIGALIAAFALCFSFASCGNDDDLDDDEMIALYEKLVSGNVKPTVTVKKENNELVLTAKYDKLVTIVETAKFSNNVCTAYTIKYTYVNEALAKEVWKNYDAEDREYAKISGKVISEDWTEDYKGESFEDILAEMEYEKRVLESGALFGF